MSTDSTLFRTEVLDSDSKHALGSVMLIYPISNYVMIATALAVFIGMILFATLASYTRHATVFGVLEPSQGVVKLYAAQAGVLKVMTVHEGQAVHKGDVLLVFETVHAGANGKTVEAELDTRLADRLAALHTERGGTLQLQAADADFMSKNLLALRSNRATLQLEMQAQQSKIATAQEQLLRFEQLAKSGFMSSVQLQQKKDDMIDLRMSLQTMQKASISADADIARLTMDLRNSPVRRQVTKAQIDQNISSTESELSRQKNNHEWSVVAPCDGTVSSLTITDNQNATTGVPLVSIIPAASQLQARLYAPSRSLGFLRLGQKVKMKLDAFPYQKFGMLDGLVLRISDSPVQASESSAGTRLAPNGETAEPMYTIRVVLDRQDMQAYGEAQRLRPGIQLEAEIELDTRRLYEWVLEPLYSLRRS